MPWNWKEAHAGKMRSAGDAALLVSSRDRVTFAMASPINTPVAVASALAGRASELRDVEIDASWSAAPAMLLQPGSEES